jgi:superfamily II DNA or RNA helicase
MEILIDSKIRIKNCPNDIKEYLVNTLRVENPKYTSAVNNGRWTGGINPYIYNFDILPDDSICIPRGMRTHLLDITSSHDRKIVDNRALFKFVEIDSSSIIFRPYQEPAMAAVYGQQEGLIVAPAGSGKTILGLGSVSMYGQPCLWLTHTKALASQAIDRISKFLPEVGEVGFIGDGKWKLGNIVTVALIPTLARRLSDTAKLHGKFGFVIIDEGHHVPASTFLTVVGMLNPYYLYGLTATPYRRDKLEVVMFQAVGPEIARISVSDVKHHGGIILPKVLYRTVHSKTISGNNVQSILTNFIVNNDKRNGMIVGDVLAEAVAGNYSVVLTDRKKHADILYDLISKGWEKTGIATGKYSTKYVKEQAQLLNDKKITVLVCTSALLGEGFDVPFLNRAFISMPFRAENKVEQIIGRVQRIADGKDDAVVYDYVDVDIGVLANQFYARGACRYNVYRRLGLDIEPY